jgi:hypothetical protein
MGASDHLRSAAISISVRCRDQVGIFAESHFANSTSRSSRSRIMGFCNCTNDQKPCWQPRATRHRRQPLLIRNLRVHVSRAARIYRVRHIPERAANPAGNRAIQSEVSHVRRAWITHRIYCPNNVEVPTFCDGPEPPTSVLEFPNSAARCAYRCTIPISTWPSSSRTVLRSTPDCTIRLAK